MKNKIKLRRSNTYVGKTVDKGEPFLDYSNRKLYIGTDDNQPLDGSGLSAPLVLQEQQVLDDVTVETLTVQNTSPDISTIDVRDKADNTSLIIEGDDEDGTGNATLEIKGTIKTKSNEVNISKDGVVINNDKTLIVNGVSNTTTTISGSVITTPVLNTSTITTSNNSGEISIANGKTFKISKNSGTTFTNKGETKLEKKLTVSSGGASIVGDATISNSLSAGNTSIGGTLTTTGNTSVGGTLTSSKKLTVSANGADITGATSINGNTTISGSLSTGNTSVGGTLTVGGNVDVTGGSVTSSGGFFSNGLTTPLYSTTMPSDFNSATTGPRIYFQNYNGLPSHGPSVPTGVNYEMLLEVFHAGSPSTSENVLQRLTLTSTPPNTGMHKMFNRVGIRLAGNVWSFSDWLEIL